MVDASPPGADPVPVHARVVVRRYSCDDDPGLDEIMAAHRAVDDSWPGHHVAVAGAQFLASGCDHGRWVATVQERSVRLVGHVGLASLTVENPALGMWASYVEGSELGSVDPFELFVEVAHGVVHPDYRIHGVSGPLTAAAVRSAVSSGKVPVAGTFTDRAAARAMLAKHGWVALGEFTGPRSGRRIVAHIAPPHLVAAAARARSDDRAGD